MEARASILAAILAAVALIALMAALVSYLSRRSVKPIEMARSNLVLRNGRLYPSNGSNAFTGVMIERFPGGSPKSRSSVFEGRLPGVFEGWHTNGQLQVLEHFAEGVSNGLRTKYYPNGQKQSEAHIVSGQLTAPIGAGMPMVNSPSRSSSAAENRRAFPSLTSRPGS